MLTSNEIPQGYILVTIYEEPILIDVSIIEELTDCGSDGSALVLNPKRITHTELNNTFFINTPYKEVLALIEKARQSPL